MRAVPKVWTLLLPAFAAAAAYSQLESQSFDSTIVPLLGRENIRKELVLDSGQSKSLDAEYQKLRQRLEALSKKKPPAEPKAFEEEQAAFAKRCAAILKPAQRTRLRQIGFQAYGIFSILFADVGRELALTKEQAAKVDSHRSAYLKKLKAIQDAHLAALRAIPQPKDPEDKQAVAAYQKRISEASQARSERDSKAAEKARSDGEKAALSVLSEAQKQAWTRMKGAPFKT